MNPRKSLPLIGIVTLCLVTWGLWKLRKPAEITSEPPVLRKTSVTDRATSSADGTSRSPARRDASANDTARDSDRLLNLLVHDSSTPPTEDEANELLDLMTKAAGWNRKELKSFIEKFMEADLSDPSRANSLGDLLVILSPQDPEGALVLYDRAREKSGFSNERNFWIHKLVLNLADQDPERAIQWVEARQDTLPPAGTEVLLEKLREKAGK